jgi:penicillin-binding protein 2
MLQVLSGDHNLALANGNRIRERVERAPRGTIYDRNRVALASNQASYDITVVPQLLPRDSAGRTAEYGRIAAMLGVPPAEIIAKSETSCASKKPDDCLTSPVPQLVTAGVDREKALAVDQSTANLPGFALDVNPIRQYSDDNLLSAFLGYTGRVNADEAKADFTYGPTDLIGKLGIEKQYESVLRGTNGGEETEVDATGKPIRVLESKQPVSGQSLVLSIDQDLERHFTEAIKKQMAASGAQRAAGVALNPKTGELLAAVSLPGYDNNKFSRGITQSDYQQLLNDPGQPLFNKVVSGGYPSGSIIKPLGVAAALQEGVVTLATTIIDSGLITVPNKYDPSKPTIYRGWERTTGLGVINPLTAIARSSDIFFYKVMGGLFGTSEDFTHPLGVNKLTDYYKKFGLGAKTGIDLPSEAAGRVPTPEWKKAFSGDGWYTGDTYNISVGQGDVLVSPLQMASAIAAIANGGTLYKPHLVDQIVDTAGKVVRQITPEIIRQGFVRADYLASVRRGMWMAVNDPSGTACCKIKEQVPVVVGGKTGTAETVIHEDDTDGAHQSRPHAWFEAFAPYDDPQIVMVVLVEHSGEGAEYAVPAARETLAWYFTQGAGAKH